MTTYKGAIELTNQNSALTRDELETFITELVSNYQNEITGLKFDTVKVSLVEINENPKFTNHLKDVPSDIIGRIKECMEEQGYKETLEDVDKMDIRSAFILSDTKEGHNIWWEVYLGNYEPFYEFWKNRDND